MASKMTICPYNANHRVKESKIVGHISKCKLNFPPGHLSICPFAYSHRVRPDQMQAHVEECPAAKLVEARINRIEDFLIPTVPSVKRDHKPEEHPDYDEWNPPASSNPFVFNPAKAAKAAILKCNKKV
jgi:Fe-S-cluster-containing dehydrogenase component